MTKQLDSEQEGVDFLMANHLPKLVQLLLLLTPQYRRRLILAALILIEGKTYSLVSED